MTSSRPSRFRAVLADLRCQLERDGLRGAWSAERWRLRAAVSSEEQLIVLAKDLDQVVSLRFEGDLRLEPLEARHLPALYELNRKRCQSRADARFATYVDRGYGGYVAFRDGELVGYYWWVDASARPPHPDLEDLGLGIELEQGDVYGSDYFLLESHRGGGTAVDFLYKLESDLSRRGYKRLWGYVVAANRPARWLYSTRGYEPMWRVASRRVLFRRRTERESIQSTEVAA